MSNFNEQTLEDLYTTVVNDSLGDFDDFNNSIDTNSTIITHENLEETKNSIMSTVKPPKPLVVNSDFYMAQEWTDWIELYEHFYHATELSKKSAQT